MFGQSLAGGGSDWRYAGQLGGWTVFSGLYDPAVSFFGAGVLGLDLGRGDCGNPISFPFRGLSALSSNCLSAHHCKQSNGLSAFFDTFIFALVFPDFRMVCFVRSGDLVRCGRIVAQSICGRAFQRSKKYLLPFQSNGREKLRE